MFSIFNKKTNYSLKDFSILKADFHSHLIPGIDDGAKSTEDSLSLIQQLIDLGFEKLITTPHIHHDYYPNTTESIQNGLQKLRPELSKSGINIDFHAAAEYYMDEHFEGLLETKTPLLKIHNNLVLVEMSFFGAPPKLEEYIFKMQMQSYKPIIAHPARYSFFKGQLAPYQRLKDMGCLFQINLLSLAGYYGKETMETAQKLIKNNLVEYLATDLHHQRHLDCLKGALDNKTFAKFVMDYEYQNATLLD
jgi:tyrosine-protein phosphatase YwqE